MDKSLIPDLVKIDKSVPVNFCHGRPMSPEPEFKRLWLDAQKDASLSMLARVKNMSDRKDRTLTIKLEAQDHALRALVNDQELFDKVISIRKLLTSKHQEVMEKRFDSRLARLMETGSDTPPPPNQNRDTSTNRGPRNTQVFQDQRTPHTQQSREGTTRSPSSKKKGQTKRPRLSNQRPGNTYNQPGPSNYRAGPPPPIQNPWGMYPMPPWPPMWYPPPMGHQPPQSPRTPRGPQGERRRKLPTPPPRNNRQR